MSGAGEPWNVPAIERALQQLLAQTDAAHASTDGEPALEQLRRQVIWEWQQRLIVERNANSESAGAAEQRYAREASIFDAALSDVLPLGALLNRIEARLGRTLSIATVSSADAIDAGLQSLAAADLDGALYAWSQGDPATVAGEVQARREPFAQQLLQRAASQFAQAATLAGDAERAELRTALRTDYLDPARRVGTELQRDRAVQLAGALDLLLAPGDTAAAAPPQRTLPPPAPQARRTVALSQPPPRRTPARTLPAPQPVLRGPLILTLAALGAVLLALIVWTLPGAMRSTGSAPTPSPLVVATPRIFGAADQTGEPAGTPSTQATARPSPKAAPSATTQPTATPRPTATPSPTGTLAPRIETIEPVELFVGALPAEFRLRGANLGQVAAVQLVAPDRQPIALELVEARADELLLRLYELPEPVEGAVEAIVVLDGLGAEVSPIVLRDFKQVLTVAGVRPEYAYTDRILEDGAGAYTTIHEAADTDAAFIAPLRNGEQVEVLSDDLEAWYRVRIRIANDPAQAGKSGWIERWLIDDAGVPDQPEPTQVPTPRATATPQPSATPPATATPRPQPTARPTPPPTAVPLRSFGAEVIASFPGSSSSGTQSSCIQGVVRARGGAGVAAAAVAANNGNSEVGTLTNGAGEYQICGLGDSTWSVLLRFVPGDPPLAREAVATLYLNGSAEQVGVVNFVER